MSINVNNNYAKDWFRRMEEHMVLLSALLNPEYIDYLNNIRGLMESWRRFNNGENINLQLLLDQTLELKRELLSVSEKQFTGLYPSLVLHMIKELHFLIRLLSGSLSLGDVVAFWGDHALDYTKLDPHMIDPSQENIISIIKNMKEELQTLNDAVLSTDKIDLLIQKTLNSKDMHLSAQRVHVPSIIHPVLLQHMIDEEQMGINMLTNILSSMI